MLLGLKPALVLLVLIVQDLDFHAHVGGVAFERRADSDSVIGALGQLEVEAKDEIRILLLGQQPAAAAGRALERAVRAARGSPGPWRSIRRQPFKSFPLNSGTNPASSAANAAALNASAATSRLFFTRTSSLGFSPAIQADSARGPCRSAPCRRRACPASLRLHGLHHQAHLLGRGDAGLGDGGRDGRVDFLVARHRGHVGFEQPRSASSFSASSARPPLRNMSAASRRCLMSVFSTCNSVFSSSGFIASISCFFKAVLSIRSVLRRSSCRAFMASVISFCTRSSRAMTLLFYKTYPHAYS